MRIPCANLGSSPTSDLFLLPYVGQCWEVPKGFLKLMGAEGSG